VNLSDLAAMGATPRWATLAIALPEENDAWLTAFARGFFRMADLHSIELIGGDTTRGPLTLSITVMGEIPPGQALRRDGAQADDEHLGLRRDRLGGAGAGLPAGAAVHGTDRCAKVLPALYLPTPRVTLGIALRGLAHSAIDVSDGLLADLGHILERSGVGARLEFGALPTLPVVQSYLHETVARDCVLAEATTMSSASPHPPAGATQSTPLQLART